MGIHYTYKTQKSMKAMEKAAKRERKLAERKAKREAKSGNKKEIKPVNKIDTNKPITLDFITSPNKDK